MDIATWGVLSRPSAECALVGVKFCTPRPGECCAFTHISTSALVRHALTLVTQLSEASVARCYTTRVGRSLLRLHTRALKRRGVGERTGGRM